MVYILMRMLPRIFLSLTSLPSRVSRVYGQQVFLAKEPCPKALVVLAFGQGKYICSCVRPKIYLFLCTKNTWRMVLANERQPWREINRFNNIPCTWATKRFKGNLSRKILHTSRNKNCQGKRVEKKMPVSTALTWNQIDKHLRWMWTISPCCWAWSLLRRRAIFLSIVHTIWGDHGLNASPCRQREGIFLFFRNAGHCWWIYFFFERWQHACHFLWLLLVAANRVTSLFNYFHWLFFARIFFNKCALLHSWFATGACE